MPIFYQKIKWSFIKFSHKNKTEVIIVLQGILLTLETQTGSHIAKACSLYILKRVTSPQQHNLESNSRKCIWRRQQKFVTYWQSKRKIWSRTHWENFYWVFCYIWISPLSLVSCLQHINYCQKLQNHIKKEYKIALNFKMTIW